jgi:hypothetical protein
VAEQVALVARTDILIAMHGAALSWAALLPPHAAVLAARGGAAPGASGGGTPFSVSTYHMPCVFRIPQVSPRHLFSPLQ